MVMVIGTRAKHALRVRLHYYTFHVFVLIPHCQNSGIFSIYLVFIKSNFGYYGYECMDQCSTFCKASRDCDHLTGFCIDGCKSGWQGDDYHEGLSWILFAESNLFFIKKVSLCLISKTPELFTGFFLIT